jgi:hypothetical protein
VSYDFCSFSPATGEDPVVTAHRILGDSEGDLEPRDHHLQADAGKKIALRDAIIRQNPKMTPFVFDYNEIAKYLKITAEEARSKFQHIELNGPGGGNGIQVILHDDYATITVPFWHQGSAAQEAFREIFGYLRVLHEAGGYVTYDPQLERVIDTDVHMAEALDRYLGVMSQLKKSFAAHEKRPWWKFW